MVLSTSQVRAATTQEEGRIVSDLVSLLNSPGEIGCLLYYSLTQFGV